MDQLSSVLDPLDEENAQEHVQRTEAAKAHAELLFERTLAYVKEHELINVIKDELATLVQHENLPFNPFISLQRRLFTEGVKQLYTVWTDARIKDSFRLHPKIELERDAKHPIVGFTDLSGISVHGLSKVCAYVDAHMCAAYYQIHHDLELSADPDVESVISFGGPALFGNRNKYNDEPEFRQDDRMHAPTKKSAQSRYVLVVTHSLDAFQLQKKGKHIVLAVTAKWPVTQPDGKKSTESRTWSMFHVAKALENEGEGVNLEHEWSRFARVDTDFGSMIRDSAVVGGEIYATCLFRIETRVGRRAPPFYQQGTINYTMHYVKKDAPVKQEAAGQSVDNVSIGGPQDAVVTVCGGIPWRSALTGIFFTQEEADEYASFMDIKLAPHVDNRAVGMYKDELLKQMSYLTPAVEYTQILDLSLRMAVHDDGWPLLAETIDAVKTRGSIIEMLGNTLDACRDMKAMVLTVPMMETSHTKQQHAIRLTLALRVEAPMESFLEEIFHMLTELTVQDELCFFGGLQLRLQVLAATTHKHAHDPEMLDFKVIVEHLRQIIKLVEWAQSTLCEEIFHHTHTLSDLFEFAKNRESMPYSHVQYYRMLPHELKTSKKEVVKKGGGGFFKGRGGRGDRDDEEEEDGEIAFVHGLEPVHNDHYVISVTQAAKRVAAPPAVQREAVLLHYLVDTQYDETVSAMVEQQMVRRPLLSNPFFECTHHVRMAMWLFELFQTSDHAIKNACMGRIDKLAEADFRRLVSLPGAGIWLHSVGVAFVGVDVDRVASVVKKLMWLANETMPSETPSGESCSTHCSVVGDVLMYGTIMDHLNLIEMHEMYHFAGRSSQAAVDFYTSQVVNHVCDLKESCDGLAKLFSNIQVGNNEVYHDYEIERSQMGEESGMRAVIDAAVKNKERIVVTMHVLMDGWRYVTVKKDLVFYFDSDDGPEESIIPKASIISEYTRVFFTKTNVPRERAEDILLDFLGDIGDTDYLEAMGNCKAFLRGQLDGCNHAEGLVDGYRHLFDYCRIGDEIERLPAVWRMFHSPVGELYYLKQLGKDLHDVIHDGVERSINSDDRDPGFNHHVVERMAQGFATKLRDIIERKTGPLSDLMDAHLISTIRMLWMPGDPPMLEMDDALADKFDLIAEGLDEYMQLFVVDVHELLPAAEELLLIGKPPAEIHPEFVHARRITLLEWELAKKKMVERKRRKAAHAASTSRRIAAGHRSSKVTFA